MLTALEWNSMDWGLRCVPAFRILFASSTTLGLIPALHSSQARRLHAVVAEWLGLSPFPWWCEMSVITLSVVESTSVLSLGLHLLWSKPLTHCRVPQACRRWGSCVPACRSAWCDVPVGVAGVPVGVAWQGEPVSVAGVPVGAVCWSVCLGTACPRVTCHLHKVLPEWEQVGGGVCLPRLSWALQGWGNIAGFNGIRVTQVADTNTLIYVLMDLTSAQSPLSPPPWPALWRCNEVTLILLWFQSTHTHHMHNFSIKDDCWGIHYLNLR